MTSKRCRLLNSFLTFKYEEIFSAVFYIQMFNGIASYPAYAMKT